MTVNTFSELTEFKENLGKWLNSELSKKAQDIYVVFFSYGTRKNRCNVWSTADKDVQTVIKRTFKFCEQLFDKNRGLPEYLKFDIAVNIEKKDWTDINAEVIGQIHNNHYRKGISFDSSFGQCFLEQEIYGKSIIKGVVYNEPNFFDEKNLNDALKKKNPNFKGNIQLSKLKTAWVFDTISAIYENKKFLALQSGGAFNGIRFIEGDKKAHIKEIVLKNAEFLHGQIQENGRFIYGYFPAFDREIKSYNTVRHCTAVYALLETLEVEYNDAYLPKIKTSIQYAINTFYKEMDGKAFLIDGNEPDQEIKLGSNAAAIFMLAKYQEITKDSQYIAYAEKLAEGIRYMVDDKGETTHVLSYPSLDVKEQFRIVYYDGEAALGLLRLYQLNDNPALLDTVKLMFEHFIEKDYDKYHDHWLSYCSNELTKICPEEKYFQFGMNNYLKHMDFIRNRKTAYATFLEMMMSAYKMVVRMREQGYDELFAQAKFEELEDLIEYRTEYQRSGFFYPEVAMYLAKPERILNAFNVRHDRLRTRIDDQEHNLSGYVAYINHFHRNGGAE